MCQERVVMKRALNVLPPQGIARPGIKLKMST